MMRRLQGSPARALTLAACMLALAWPGAPLGAASGGHKGLPGFVDAQKLIDLVGDDAVLVEVSLHGALLRALTRVDPELHALVGGVESIHAVIVELPGERLDPRVVEAVRATERGLLGRGWERLARVRDDDGELKVLVLARDERIEGLVVLGVDREEDRLVFANLAGLLDLDAISRIGAELDIPGLDGLDGP